MTTRLRTKWMDGLLHVEVGRVWFDLEPGEVRLMIDALDMADGYPNPVEVYRDTIGYAVFVDRVGFRLREHEALALIEMLRGEVIEADFLHAMQQQQVDQLS